MDFEQAKEIIQKMVDGTVTTEEETALEAWALQHIGRVSDYDGSPRVVLGHKSPRGGGQLHYRSVREEIERAREIAENWCDVIRTHPALGMMDGGDDTYTYPVHASEYTESVEREEGGNFFEVTWAPRELGYKQDTIARFSCAEGNVKDEGSHDLSEAMYLFDRDFVQCADCVHFNAKGLTIACPQCLACAIASGKCFLEKATA